MTWIFLLIYIIIAWFTLRFARISWKKGKKFSSIIIVILVLILVALAVGIFIIGTK